MPNTVGSQVALQVQASDGRTDLFCEIRVLLGAAQVADFRVLSGPGAVYTALWVPGAPGSYVVLAQFFADAGYSVDAGYDLVTGELDIASTASGVSLTATPAGTSSAPPNEAALEPDPADRALGVYHADLVIQTAIAEGVRRLRHDPEGLATVWAGILADPLVAEKYGGEVGQFADWVRRNDVPVVAEHSLTGSEAVAVSVSDADGQEAEVTLADLHYETSQDAPGDDLSEFSALSYSPLNGELVLPASAVEGVELQAGFLIVDDAGEEHAVAEVLADDVVVLADRPMVSFRRARLRLPYASRRAPVGSALTRRTFRVGCHTNKPNFLIWLHGLVYYVLKRYNQELLEHRGFERVVVGSGPFSKDDRFGSEHFWTRFVTVTGYCRDSWSGDPQGRVLSQGGALEVVEQSSPADPVFEDFGGVSIADLT